MIYVIQSGPVWVAMARRVRRGEMDAPRGAVLCGVRGEVAWGNRSLPSGAAETYIITAVFRRDKIKA